MCEWLRYGRRNLHCCCLILSLHCRYTCDLLIIIFRYELLAAGLLLPYTGNIVLPFNAIQCAVMGIRYDEIKEANDQMQFIFIDYICLTSFTSVARTILSYHLHLCCCFLIMAIERTHAAKMSIYCWPTRPKERFFSFSFLQWICDSLHCLTIMVRS